jgi:DNA modification methylase
MAVTDQEIADRYALYNGDCIETMARMPAGRVALSVYSPPFGGLYKYSSSERDLSNSLNYNDFFAHYEFVVRELHRVTMPGRMSAVHCSDIASGNSGNDYLTDFPGDIIRLHEKLGWRYTARYAVWKEPLGVRNRTMTKSLSHRGITEDSTKCSNAMADWLLMFRRSGQNAVPVAHPTGLLSYAGERRPPNDVLQYRGWTGSQLENRYSHWIWRQYASAFWDDVRLGRVLPFREAREEDDEAHVHPLQLDVIERAVTLWSNPNEVVLTPFMGVGSEVFGAVQLGRRGVGIELKRSYYMQACRNMKAVDTVVSDQHEMALGDAGMMDDVLAETEPTL